MNRLSVTQAIERDPAAATRPDHSTGWTPLHAHHRASLGDQKVLGVPSPPKGSAALKPIHAAGESCGVGLHGVTAMATGYIPTLIAVPGELVAVLIGARLALCETKKGLCVSQRAM